MLKRKAVKRCYGCKKEFQASKYSKILWCNDCVKLMKENISYCDCGCGAIQARNEKFLKFQDIDHNVPILKELTEKEQYQIINGKMFAKLTYCICHDLTSFFIYVKQKNIYYKYCPYCKNFFRTIKKDKKYCCIECKNRYRKDKQVA